MTLKTSMQRRACQMRDCRLKRVEAIIKRQQRVPAESDDDSFWLQRQNCRV
jgi:hypothetical protein